MERKGVSPDTAKALFAPDPAVIIGALMVNRGEADALIAGLVGRTARTS